MNKLLTLSVCAALPLLTAGLCLHEAPSTQTGITPVATSSGSVHPSSALQPLPASRAMAAPNFVDAAQASVHAVVHVQTASVVADRSNPWLSMLGLAEGRLAQGSGSGVIVDEEGLVVTNHHVIQGARTILVNTSDGMRYEASLVGSDPSTDLALLRIQADEPLPSLPYGDSDETRVGEWVLAVGNPLNLTSTVTAGIVSAKGRNIRLLEGDVANNVFPVESFIQTDAAVNPGNSGGALVNTKGELIGINTAIASQTGSYAGYSFAIPSSIVQKVVRDLREFGVVQRAFLGVQLDAVAQGLRIASVRIGGGAAKAGLREGDVIERINGHPVRTFPELQERLSRHRPGDRVTLAGVRDQKAYKRSVELGPFKPRQPMANGAP